MGRYQPSASCVCRAIATKFCLEKEKLGWIPHTSG